MRWIRTVLFAGNPATIFLQLTSCLTSGFHLSVVEKTKTKIQPVGMRFELVKFCCCLCALTNYINTHTFLLKSATSWFLTYTSNHMAWFPILHGRTRGSVHHGACVPARRDGGAVLTLHSTKYHNIYVGLVAGACICNFLVQISSSISYICAWYFTFFSTINVWDLPVRKSTGNRLDTYRCFCK
jgi:hypothetical protein